MPARLAQWVEIGNFHPRVVDSIPGQYANLHDDLGGILFLMGYSFHTFDSARISQSVAEKLVITASFLGTSYRWTDRPDRTL